MNANSEGPVILAAFANDRRDQTRFLRNLSVEAQRIQAVLAPAQSLCPLVLLPSATLDEILTAFQTYRDRIVVFHFAGHANGFQLLLESSSGGVHRVGAKGLASFLGQQQGLQLVFLNGCSTERQAEDLLNAGVGCVIATTQAIDDGVATDFSARFYQGIVTGAPLQSAYSEAVGSAQAASGGSIDRLLVPVDDPEDVPHETGRWPWLLKFKPGAERVAQWSLPEAAGDPLFGLPPVAQRDLPESPYRHLYRFEAEHAEVFFGRGQEIRELYQRVTASDAAPVVLFYGPSGVGKSSLLDAGLIPRLTGKNDVRYVRRDPARGLGETLRSAFPKELQQLSRGDAWIAAEKELGRPLVIVLDQVEEVFTKPNTGQPHELAEFAQLLRRIFYAPHRRPQGKLILGFRKEWFAELDELLADAQVPRSRIFLERLSRRGAIEAIAGPVDDLRLASQYKLQIEDGLPDLIADDLLADPDTPVAPTLQILLTRMWSEACRLNREQPTFDAELYQSLHRHGILLDDFLRQQTDQIRERLPRTVESGFLLDLLEYHTTAVGTSAEHPLSVLETMYAEQAKSGLLSQTLSLCEELYLLTFSRGADEGQGRSSRLLHDTLAPLIRARHQDSDLPGQRSRRILDNRIVDWLDGQIGSPLDANDLKEVEAALAGSRSWSPDEQRLVAASRERRISNRRWSRIFKGLGLAAVVLIAVFGVVAYIQRAEAVAQKRVADAQTITAKQETEKARLAQAKADAAAVQARQEQARSDRTLAAMARDQEHNGVKAAHYFAAAAAAVAIDDRKQSDELRLAAGLSISGLTLKDTLQGAGEAQAAWMLENGAVCEQTFTRSQGSGGYRTILNLAYVGPEAEFESGTAFLNGRFRTARYSPNMERCVLVSERTIEARDRLRSSKQQASLGDARISQQADVVVTWGRSGASVIVNPWEAEAVPLMRKSVDVARVSDSGNRLLTWSAGEPPVLWSRPVDSSQEWTNVLLPDVGATTYDQRLSPEFLDGEDGLVVWSVAGQTVHAWHYSPAGQLQLHASCELTLDGRCGWTSPSSDPLPSDRKPGRAFFLWDSPSQQVWAWRLQPTGDVASITPNPTYLGHSIGGLSASTNGQVAVWSDEDAALLQVGQWRQFAESTTLDIPHDERIQEATFSPDGTKLLVWTAHVLQPLGETITGGGENPPGSVQVWEVEFGLPVTASLKAPQPIRGARWSPDGLSFVVWGEHPLVQSWEVATRPQTHQVVDWAPETPLLVEDSGAGPDIPPLDESDDKSYRLFAQDQQILIAFSPEKGGGTQTIRRNLPVHGVRFIDAGTTVLEWGGLLGKGYVSLWQIDAPNRLQETISLPQPVSFADIDRAKGQLLVTTIPNSHTHVRAETVHWWGLSTRVELMSPLRAHTTSPARFGQSENTLAFPRENQADQFHRGPVPPLTRQDPRWDVILRTGTFIDPIGDLTSLYPPEITELRKLLSVDEATWPTVPDWVNQVLDRRNTVPKDSF